MCRYVQNAQKGANYPLGVKVEFFEIRTQLLSYTKVQLYWVIIYKQRPYSSSLMIAFTIQSKYGIFLIKIHEKVYAYIEIIPKIWIKVNLLTPIVYSQV